MKKYTYFIAYTDPKGFGSINLISQEPSIDGKILNDFAELIKDITRSDNVVITNIIPLPIIHPNA